MCCKIQIWLSLVIVVGTYSLIPILLFMIIPLGTLTQLSKKHLKNDEQKENNRQLANTDLQKQIYTNWSAELSNADKYVAATNVQNVILLFKKFEGELMGNFYSSNGMKSFADIYRPYLNEDYPKREDLKIQNIGQSPTPQDIRIVNNAEECKAVLNELKQYTIP